MTFEEHNIIEITIDAEEKFAEGYFLPDRYLDTRLNEKLWLKLMPAGRKLKDYTQVIVDFSDLPKKAAKMMPIHIILSRMLAHSSLREVVYQKLDHSKPIQSDLFLEKNLTRYWKRLPESFIQSPRAEVSSELQALMPEFLYEHDADVLSLIANREAYEALDYETKDIADLIANLLLIRIGSDELICKYLDEFNFIGERQTKLRAYAYKKLNENNSQHKAQALTTKWKQFLVKLINDLNEAGDLNIGLLSSMGVAINKVMQDKLTSPAVAFQVLLDEDIDHFKKVTGKLINKCEQAIRDGGEVNFPQWLIDAKKIIEEAYVAPNFNTLTARQCELTQDYIEKREDIFRNQTIDILEIDTKIKETYNLRKEISEIIAGNNLAKMSQMGEIGSKLAESVTAVNDMASVMIDAFTRHDEVLKAYLSELVADEKAESEIPAPVQVEIPPLVPNASDVEIRKSKTEITRLTRQLKKITTLQESQMQRLTQTLILKEEAEEKLELKDNELKAAKEQLHHARQQMSYIHSPKSEAPGHELSDLLRSHLKNERDDVESLLETFALIAPDRLLVLPSAYKSAKEASNFELTARLAGIIDSLVFSYLDSIRSGIPDSEAKNILGNRYAAKESDTVFQSAKLRSLREFNYNDETYYFEQHIGLGSGYGTQHAIRLHFKIIDNKVVVAYCGKHLETARTN